MNSRPSSRAAALSCAIFAALSSHSAFGQLRAFGEAEGFGMYATGARTGTVVYHVTNLNNSGAGSFRDAVSQPNRFVVFDVGGNITLTSEVSVKSNTTIAGQTAPGGGVQINGAEVSFGGTSNSIARHIRFRPGDASSSTANGVNLYNASNIVLDHVSIAFSNYNNIDAVGSNNITVQNSVLADPIDQQFGAHSETLGGQFTWSNNLWTNSHNRQPLAKINTQFKNNVIYNYSAAYTVSDTSGNFSHDIINNYFITGPADPGGSKAFYDLNTKQKMYASGNLRENGRDGVLSGSTVSPSGNTVIASPWSATTTDLPTLSATDAYAYVIAHSGASLMRDELDDLVFDQVQTLGQGTTGYVAGTAGPDGGLYHHAYNTGLSNGGLGTIAIASRPAGFDADNDGIAGAWETAHGLNPGAAADALSLNPLGYLMIEQYVNELGDVNDSRTWTASSGASWATASNWTGAVAPGVYDHALVRGTAAASGWVTASTAINAMTLSIGGGGTGTGEKVSVASTGNLRIYDTLTVGDQGNAFLDISGGTVTAYNVVLGNTVYLPAATNYTGTLTLNSGTLGVAQLVLGAGTPGAWNTGGTLKWNGGTVKAVGALKMNVPVLLSISGGTFDTNGFDGTVSSTFTELVVGEGNLTKKGLGKLTLTGTSTYTGVTKISAGTLAVATLTDGGTAGPLGAASSAASKIVLDGGTLAYTGTAAAGTTNRLMTLTANGGTLDGGASAGFAITGTGIFGASGSGNRSLTLLGTGTNNSFSADLADPAGGKTSLVMGGTGRWILNGAAAQRAYSGDTVINAGTLLGFVANTLPFGAGRGNLVVNAGGIFELNGNALSINALNGAGNVNQRTSSKSPTLTLGNGDASGSFTGTLTNAGSTALMNLVKTGIGTQTLSGVNSYGGTTTISAGTLALDGVGTLGTGQVMVGAGGTLKLNPTLTKSLKVAANFFIAGTSAAPTGKVDLTTEGMVIDYSTTVGTLLADTTARVNAGRGLRNANGVHAFDALGITSSTAGANNLAAGFDKFSVGAINNADLTAFGLTAYTTFGGQTVDASSVLVRYTYNGDANLDGVLNATDYTLLNKGFAGTIPNVGWLSGDFTGDGLIDADDYAVLDFGYLKQGAALGLGDPVAVPEPMGLVALGVGSLLAAGGRRRR